MKKIKNLTLIIGLFTLCSFIQTDKWILKKQVIGTWEAIDYKYKQTVTFSIDGSFTQITLNPEVQKEPISFTNPYKFISKNKIKIDPGNVDETSILKLSIVDDVLILEHKRLGKIRYKKL